MMLCGAYNCPRGLISHLPRDSDSAQSNRVWAKCIDANQYIVSYTRMAGAHVSEIRRRSNGCAVADWTGCG